MSLSGRRYRAGIYHYVDIGTDGRSDPAYVKQESSASDGNWWFSVDQMDGDEVIRGGKPEYRMRGIFGFPDRFAPLENEDGVPNPKGVVILWAERQQIWEVRAIIPRLNNQNVQQVRVELAHESKQTATYSDDYYYAD